MLRSVPRTIWPHAYPVYALTMLAASVGFFAACVWFQASNMAPLQRFYLGTYIRLTVLPVKQNVRLVEVVGPRGPLMAVDPWVVVRGTPEQPVLSISEQGAAAGLHHPFLVGLRRVAPDRILSFLRGNIYPGSLSAMFTLSLWMFGAAALLLLPIGCYLDWRHEERARTGVQIRGPKLLTPRQAAKRIRGDGIALFLDPGVK